MFKELWAMYAQGYGRVRLAVVVCVLAVVISLLEGLNIGLLVPLLESLGSSAPGEKHVISKTVANLYEFLGLSFGIGSILLSLGILITFTAVLKYVRMILVAKLRAGFTAWIRTQYMESLVQADVSYFHNARLGVMTDTLSTQSHAAGGTILEAVEMLSNFTMFLAYMVAAFLVSPLLTLAAIGLLAVVSLAMQYYVAQGRIKGAEQVLKENELQASAVESLSGISVVKSFLLERFRWLDFSGKADDVAQMQYKIARDRSQMQAIQDLSLFGLIGGIVYLGCSVLSMDFAVIVALLFVLSRLAPRVNTLNSLRHSFAESMAALHAVSNAIKEPAERKITSGDTPFYGLKNGIQMEGIYFSYGNGTQVLSGTGFNIEKGSMVAIVGASGAGKSTLIDLLLRFYDPDAGSILVDGVDLRDLNLTTWRRSIGIVSQDIFLFNDTVRNNIMLGRDEISEEQLILSAKQAYSHDFIMNLPNGYDTSIGDRGLNLSGGQRQRIALARAILLKPEILVLDEATSSLDSESEHLIQNYMGEIRGTCTMIVVAHRTATIRDADRIVVVQDGKIVEEGDWNSLVGGEGVFASYQQLQAGG